MDQAWQPVKFKKKPHRKVKTGCQTCKTRRVKCDEARPYCLRCSTTGRKCPGYRTDDVNTGESPESDPNKPTKGSAETGFNKATRKKVVTQIRPASAVTSAKRPLQLPSTPTFHFGSTTEIESFQFFYEKSVAVLRPGTFLEGWHEVVLPLARTEPLIKSIVIAISWVHRRVARPTQQDVELERRFFLQHYQKALRLTSSVLEDNVGLVLVACILFNLCDYLAGRNTIAMTHIIAASKIMQDYYEGKYPRSKNAATDLMIEKVTMPILTSAKQYLILFEESEAFSKVATPADGDLSSPGRDEPIDLPSEFVDISEAERHLDIIFRSHVECDAITPLLLPHQLFNLPTMFYRMTCWMHLFDAVLATPLSVLDPSKAAAGSLVRAYGPLINILVRCVNPTIELKFDIAPLWASLIHILEPVIERHRETARSNPFYDAGVESIGYIFPMFFAATRCRDPKIRRYALGLLSIIKKWEGLWTSTGAFHIARTIMMIEERNEAVGLKRKGFLSPESRIRAVGVNVDLVTREARLEYVRFPYDVDGAVYEELILDWLPDQDEIAAFPLTSVLRLSGYQGIVPGMPLLDAKFQPQDDSPPVITLPLL